MKILQKLFAIILLFVFSITATNATSYYDFGSDLTKEVILAKKELKTDKQFSKLIPKIDKIFEKIANDKEKLEKLQTKINNIELKIYQSKNLKKYSRHLKLLNYLSAKNALYLYKLNKKIEEKEELQAKNKLEEMNNSNLSESDKKLVEKKLVNIQLSLLDNAKGNFDSLLKDFDKLTNYEEKGNMKLNFQIDQELVGKLKAEISANNYTTKNSGFNQEFSGKVKALVDASLKGQEDFKLELNTFVNYISKDGNIYLLLKDLNIVNNNNEKKVKEAISKIKEIAKKNKYIKFEDRDTKQALELIKNINPKQIFSDGEELLKKPLFTAYKKEGKKYYLIPTKYACEKYKEIAGKFDPWNGNTCSDSQYKDMLKELSKAGNITLEIGNKNKLSFVAIPSYGVKSFNSEIVFTDKNIESIHSELIAEKKGEGFEFSYIKNNKLALYINAGEDFKSEFKSSLDKNNNFNSIDFFLNSKGYKSDFNAKLKLQNKKLTGGFESNYEQYDWEKNKFEKYNLSASLEGNQNYKKQLENISFSINGKNKTQNKKTFSSNISFKNKNISGTTIIFDKQGKEYIKITNTGKYDTNYLKLNNKIELAESPLKRFTGNIKNQKAEANINIDIDARNNKNNANIFIIYKEGKKEILKIEIDNKGTIEYKKVEIKAPTNTIDASELNLAPKY